MKYSISLVVAIMLFAGAKAQYYYNDIIVTQQTNDTYKLLRSNKIKKAKAINKDANDEVIDGFSIEQELSSNGRKMVTTTSTSEGLASEVVSYYENDRIIKTEQKQNNVNSSVEYSYDAEGRLLSIVSRTKDTIINSLSKQEHFWQYNAKGQPEQMLRVENGKDTIKVVLVYENGNPAAEQWLKGNMKIETYYYYFDAGKRITDIVRLNENNGKMVPDNLYAYDNEGRLISMIQPLRTGGSNYLLWKYSYNAQGLKAKETAYDKNRKILGVIEYSYN